MLALPSPGAHPHSPVCDAAIYSAGLLFCTDVCFSSRCRIEAQLATDRLTLAPARTAQSLEELAYRYGRSYDSYLATEADRLAFFSPTCDGAIAYVCRGRWLYATGGLLAPPESKLSLLEAFVAAADRAGVVPAFFNIADDELPLFREFGFQATKWGEEAIVDLTNRTWRGHDFAWLRRQANFCRRQGVTIEECHPHLMAEHAWRATVDELNQVSAASMAGKPQRGEIRLLEGRFEPEELGRRRLFIARADGGRIEGFLACHPALDGARWVLETYRYRPDAVRGACACLMYEALRMLQSEGADSASLCLVPGLRCAQPLAGDSALARWGIVVGTRYFGLVHDAAGMYHFKTRFRPRFENRYLCVRPRITAAWAYGLVRTLGVLRLDPRVVASDAFARWRKRRSRHTLQGLVY